MVGEASVDNFICILQKCRKTKDLNYAKRLHTHLCNTGLEVHKNVGNHIVPMFVQCGSVREAQMVFDKLVYRNEYSWTSLISGYIDCGQLHNALNLYIKMQDDKVNPSSYTLTALLKACASLKDVETGRKIHVGIAGNGSKSDGFVGNALMDMYIKCGSLGEAREVFDKLPIQDMVSWTALIAGYAEHGNGEEALRCFERMQQKGISPDAVTFVCILRACRSIGAIDKGRRVHIEITKNGFDKDVFIGSALIDMYAKGGSLSEAREVFDKLFLRDIVTWTALIGGYAEHGHGQEALDCFDQMQEAGICPNAFTFVCSLKACGNMGALVRGRELHAEIARHGFAKDLFVGNSVVDMYAKCASLAEAMEAFDKMPVHDVVSWNSLIGGHVDNGFDKEALQLVDEMHQKGMSANAITFVCCLKACNSIGTMDKGQQIHAEVRYKGLEKDPVVGGALVGMYAKGGSLLEAQDVFDKLPVRDVVSWTALIAGYADHGSGQEALERFEQMKLDGVSPNAVTFICILKACISIGSIERGRAIHNEIVQNKLEKDLFVGNTLIDMYSKFHLPADAREIFDKLPIRDVVSWNALLTGYVENGLAEEAMTCFKQMQVDGISANAITYISMLKACAYVGAIDEGREIHSAVAQGGLEKDLFVSNSLVDMYAKCRSMTEAQELFNNLSVHDVISWNALITGYIENGLDHEALKCFEQMKFDGVLADAVTYVCVLKATAGIGAIDKAREIHAEVKERGFERDIFICNTLVDMYAKSGFITEAREIFDKLPVWDVVSWNAMIRGYGTNHEGDRAVECFENMQACDEKPDAITFTCLLSACGRASLVLEGQRYFHMMREKYGMTPTTDHYTCMIDIFARSGHLCEAEKLLEIAEYPLSKETFTAVLSACETYGAVDLGPRCFQRLVQMSPENAASFVMMANIFVNSGNEVYE